MADIYQTIDIKMGYADNGLEKIKKKYRLSHVTSVAAKIFQDRPYSKRYPIS